MLARTLPLVYAGALAFVVFMKLINGDINTRYLLYQLKNDGTREISSGRVQLLILTLLVAAKYLYDAIRLAPSGHLPDVSTQTLVLLSGSHATYLGGKAWATFFTDGVPPVKEIKK